MPRTMPEDGCGSVDDELPRVGIIEKRTGDEPDDDYEDADDESTRPPGLMRNGT